MMGAVLQLRVPAQKLGHNDVLLIPRETNAETARDVVANPQAYTLNMLRAACIWLRANGDWMDQERARHLLKVLDRQARLKAVSDASCAKERRRLVIASVFFLAVIVCISLFDIAWSHHLAVVIWGGVIAIYLSGWASTCIMLGTSTMIKDPVYKPTKVDVWLWFGLSAVWPIIVWVVVAAAFFQEK